MRWLGPLFRRKRTPDPEQWQPGDLAECLRDGPWFTICGQRVAGPRLGERRIVRGVSEGPAIHGETATFLRFATGGNRFLASQFRKVTPRADALEAGTANSIADLRPAQAPTPEPAEQKEPA